MKVGEVWQNKAEITMTILWQKIKIIKYLEDDTWEVESCYDHRRILSMGSSIYKYYFKVSE